jgi:hypothetical protein
MTFAGIGTIAWLQLTKGFHALAFSGAHAHARPVSALLRTRISATSSAWGNGCRAANALGVRGAWHLRHIYFGRHHACKSTFFELAGHPVEVEFIVSHAEAQKLLALVHQEGIRLFYACVPALFGVINPDGADEAALNED